MRKALRGNWAVLTANLIGFFLIFAAILKLLQLTDLTWYVSATAFDSLIAKIGIVLDLSFAALLLSGLWRKRVLQWTGFLFAAFAYANLTFLWSNQNCGCFGKWTPDSFTMIVLDSSIAVFSFAVGRFIGTQTTQSVRQVSF